MSRSRKKNPVIGYSCKETEKYDKIFANRKFRKRNKHLLRKNKELLFKIQEVSDIWNFQKDGKHDLRYSNYWSFPELKEEIIEEAYRK